MLDVNTLDAFKASLLQGPQKDPGAVVDATIGDREAGDPPGQIRDQTEDQHKP